MHILLILSLLLKGNWLEPAHIGRGREEKWSGLLLVLIVQEWKTKFHNKRRHSIEMCVCGIWWWLGRFRISLAQSEGRACNQIAYSYHKSFILLSARALRERIGRRQIEGKKRRFVWGAWSTRVRRRRRGKIDRALLRLEAHVRVHTMQNKMTWTKAIFRREYSSVPLFLSKTMCIGRLMRTKFNTNLHRWMTKNCLLMSFICYMLAQSDLFELFKLHTPLETWWAFITAHQGIPCR